MLTRLSQFVLGACIVALLAAATPGKAGGAWPRGKGKLFASVTYSTFGNLIGYAQGLYAPYPGVVYPELTEEIGYYAEYGLTPRLTFGLDRHERALEDTTSTIWFLRANFSRPNWRSSYGLEIGFGPWRGTHRWILKDDTQYRAGVSWGRGYESRWFTGWVDVDAKVSALETSRAVFWKVDTTFGVNTGESSLAYLQMQSGAFEGFDTYTRAVPTYVFKFQNGLSVESAALIGLVNDEAYGMKMGLWLEF